MESGFSLEITPYAKETEGYAIFQTTLNTQQTAAEQTPDLPSEPTNAEICLQDSPALPWHGSKVKTESGAQ